MQHAPMLGVALAEDVMPAKKKAAKRPKARRPAAKKKMQRGSMGSYSCCTC